MLDDCDYDKRLGANEPKDFPAKRFGSRNEKRTEIDTALESSESSCSYFILFVFQELSQTSGHHENLTSANIDMLI